MLYVLCNMPFTQRLVKCVKLLNLWWKPKLELAELLSSGAKIIIIIINAD